MKKLGDSFYQRIDVLQISRELLGKFLVTNIGGKKTVGMITEVEAYAGIDDKASHAHGSRLTARNEPMYGEGGMTYVYLCYGIHHLFNVVTNTHSVPHAILIRAVEPVEGVEIMMKRRKKKILEPTITSGPGAMSQALGITTQYTNRSLQGPDIWIEDRGVEIDPKDIIAASRVGVSYAAEDAKLPYRFYIKGNSFVSKAKGL